MSIEDEASAPPQEVAARLLPYPATLHDWIFRFGLHLLTGSVAVAAHYSLMWLLLRMGVGPLVSSFTGFIAGAVTRYLLSYFKVFSPSGSVPSTVIRFIAALAAQMLANTALLALFMRMGLDLWIAQASATILLTFANYLAYRLWVFR